MKRIPAAAFGHLAVAGSACRRRGGADVDRKLGIFAADSRTGQCLAAGFAGRRYPAPDRAPVPGWAEFARAAVQCFRHRTSAHHQCSYCETFISSFARVAAWHRCDGGICGRAGHHHSGRRGLISDPVAFDAPPGSDLAVSMHFDHAPAQQTSHPGSRSTSYLVHGDHVSAPDLPGAQTFDHWFNLSGVEIPVARRDESVVVTLGDSITDGHGATTNGNDRWPDDLARRLMEARLTRSVLNRGIGGGRILLDGLGPNALARFDRDVLAEPGVRTLIILEGINDIGTFDRAGTLPAAAHAHLVAELTAAYAQMVMRAHSAGIKVYGATLTPFADNSTYNPHPLSEADRVALNDWIRAPGHVDAVIDFDKAIRDPASPDHMTAAYDSGDHLHPSAAGYHAMADAIPLSLFAP